MTTVRRTYIKWTIELVRQVVEANGYTLLSEKYEGVAKKYDMICPKGHRCQISLRNFNRKESGRRCGKKICVQERAQKSNMENFGTLYPSQNPTVTAKSVQTNLRKRGVRNAMMDPAVQEKARQTTLKNWGVPYPAQHPAVQVKLKQSNLLIRGVENPGQDPKVQEKMRQTNMIRWGVPYAVQNAEIFEKLQKALYARKPYTFPSGRIVYVQGYEPRAIDYLLSNDINEDDIVFGLDIPRIAYVNADDQQSVYHPDMFLPIYNTIVEVKSTYTYELHKEKNLLKFEATKKRGYNLYVFIFDNKKLVETLYYPSV